MGLGCQKINLEEDAPRCIKREIRKILEEPVRRPPAEMWRYEYKGKTVYYVPPSCCDRMSVLFDSDCNIICNPDGGFHGGGDGTCLDFSSLRTNGTLIWKDDDLDR